ncbi:unnamed protein product [Rangifer tarandus platyrhynchus]|uniref:Uncharacterized protein n=1 Tax=Rangifer tarandus platyrhynchus TaxID=3082113 RepID=A0AC59ZKP9_RANTA
MPEMPENMEQSWRVGWERPERVRPLSGASAERGQLGSAVLAAEAGSGERGLAQTYGRRAQGGLELRPAAIPG